MIRDVAKDLLGLREVTSAPEDVFDQFNHLRDRLLGDLTASDAWSKSAGIRRLHRRWGLCGAPWVVFTFGHIIFSFFWER